MKIPVDVFYSVIEEADKAKQKRNEEQKKYEAKIERLWQEYQQEWTAKGVQPNLALRAPGVANVLAAINQALAPTAGMLSPERLATFAPPAEPQAPITPFREVTQAPMGYAPRSAMPDLSTIAPPVKPVVPESVPGKAAARVVESFLQQMPGGRAVDVTETGKPGVDVATGLVGGTASHIGQLMAAQQLATLLAGALVSEQARKAIPPLATALGTGAAARGIKWGAHKTADPESVSGKDLAKEIAFGAGAGAAGQLASGALRHAYPGIHPLIEAPVAGAAAGAAGAAAGYPFSDKKGMDYLKEMGNTILAQAILQTVWTAGTPSTWQPKQNFGRSMVTARKYHDDIFEAFEGNNERAANIAYREFQKSMDNALHYAHQAGATPDPAAWRAKAEDVILQGFKMRGWTPHAEAPTPEPATGPAQIPAPKPELPAPVAPQALVAPVAEPAAPAVQPIMPAPVVEPTPAVIPEPKPATTTEYAITAPEKAAPIQSPSPEPIPEPESMPELPEKAPGVSPEATKEPWQMTRDEFANAVENEGLDFQPTYKNGASGATHAQRLALAKATGDNVDVEQKAFDNAVMRAHEAAVIKAYLDSKPVPPEVLADYPDLAKPAEAPAEAGSAPTIPGDAETVLEVQHEPEMPTYDYGPTIEEALSLISDSDIGEYEFLRWDPKEYQPGDTMPKSRRWDDGEPTDEELYGTSAIDPSYKGWTKQSLWSRYKGNVYLVEGTKVGWGEDEGEVLLRDAKVVRKLASMQTPQTRTAPEVPAPEPAREPLPAVEPAAPVETSLEAVETLETPDTAKRDKEREAEIQRKQEAERLQKENTEKLKARLGTKPVAKGFYGIQAGIHSPIEYVQLKAKPVKIPGFEEFDIMIHRGFTYPKIGMWVLSEGTTGMSMMSGEKGETQKHLIARLTTFLSELGKDRFHEYINKAVDMGRVSPRYAGIKDYPYTIKTPESTKPKGEGWELQKRAGTYSFDERAADNLALNIRTSDDNKEVEVVSDPGNPNQRLIWVRNIPKDVQGAEGHVTTGRETKRPVENIRAHREDEAPETIETPTPKTEGKPATTEPVGKQDIIRYMSENLLVPIRVGRMFSKRARGEYKINQRVARLKKANNLPTAFHEVGHHLEQVMELSAKDLASYNKELLPLLGTRYANETPAVRLSEGFAEFFRLYMTEPDAAKKAAPSFYDYFDELVDKSPADLRKHIDTAKDMHKQYHMQSAADRVGAMIVDTPPETKPFLTKKEQIYTDWVDDLYPLYKAMKELYPEEIKSEKDVPMHLNAYVLRRLANSSPRSAAGMLTNGMSSPELEVIGPSYNEILEPVADRLEEFERYITALHALEIEDRGMESGFDRADCEATIELYDSPEFRKAAEGRERFMDNLLDWLVDSGALSQSSVTAMRKTYEHHVSFYRVFDEGGLRGPRHGGKKTVDLPRPVKRQYGSTRPIYSPIQNDILNTFYFMDIAKRSYAAKALAGLADKAEGKGWLIEKVPAPQQVSKVELKRLKDDLIAAGIPEEDLADADLERIALVFNPQRFAGFKEKQENVFAIHRGERVDFYQVHPDLYATLQALDTPASNWLIRLLGSISEPLHVGAVGTLSFGGRNIVKDTSTKLIHSEATPIDLGKDFVKGFAHALKKDDLYAEYEASGGGQAGRVSLSRHDLEKKVADMFPKNERATTRVINAFAKPYVALKGLIELGEEGSRIGEFTRRRGDDPTREDKLWAAYLSREVTVDFQRGGRKGRQWNLVVRFFNPGLQGTDKLARDFKANPGRVLLRGALISLISLLTFLKNKDNPRYLDESRYRRDNFWCFYPTESINLYIPKGFEAGMIFGSAPERFLEWMYHKDPGAMKEFAKSVFDELSPDIIPTAMAGLVEQIANKSLLTGAPIVPAAEQRLEPRDQYGPQTTAPAITLGQALNVSPRRIEAMISSYTGGMGLEVLDFLDLLAGEATSKRAPTQLIPGVKGFVGRPYVGSRAVTQLYEEKEKLERQKASYDRAWKQGKEPKAEPNWARLDLLKSTANYLTTLRKERDWIMEESGYAPTEKRKRVDDINRQIAEEAQRAMTHFIGM